MTGLLIAAAGDILVDREEPRSALASVRPLLEGADLALGNFEGVLTDSHGPTPGSAHATVVPAANAEGLRDFDFLSLANNHAMDAGYGGLADTIAALTSRGIAIAGAGSTLAQALAPAVFERRGIRVGVLAVTSVLRAGGEATEALPGVAPLRADDLYGPPVPGLINPGLPPRVVSQLNQDDWARLAGALSELRDRVDLLVVCAHWGDYTQPWVLTAHERSSARLLVEAGADIVLGHHHHFMRGVELQGGRPIMYGLGHLAFDHPRFIAEMRTKGVDLEAMGQEALVARYGEYGIFPRPETPTLPFHPLARRTGIALLEAGTGGVRRIGLVPCLIDETGTARPVSRRTEGWETAATFLRDCMRRAALPTDVCDRGWTRDGFDVLDVEARRPDWRQS